MRPQSFIFPDANRAADFLNRVISEGRDELATMGMGGGARSLPRSFWDKMLDSSGGWRWYESTSGKEQIVYGYQDHIWDQDLVYLHERDPMVHALNSRPPRDTWFEFPRTRVDVLDDFFAFLAAVGGTQRIMAADTLARRDGVAFILIDAPGDPSTRLKPGQDIYGLDFITKGQVDEKSVIYSRNREHLINQHGIRSLKVHVPIEDKNGNAPGRTQTMEIHGSRLILVSEDFTTRDWRRRPKIQPIYDTVWNIRDIEHAQTHAQFEGDPVGLEMLPPDKGGLLELDDESHQQLESELRNFATGSQQVLSPIQGITIKRLGGQKLQDADGVIRLLASRVAFSTEFPVNMVLASSRGSEQVTDQDVMEYISAIDIRRSSFAYPLLAHLVQVGKYTGMIPAETQLPSPQKLAWPSIRTYNLRELAYAWSTFARTMDIAETWGRDVPPEITELFPKIPGAPIYVDNPQDKLDLEREKIEAQKEAAKEAAKRPPPGDGGGGGDKKERPPSTRSLEAIRRDRKLDDIEEKIEDIREKVK